MWFGGEALPSPWFMQTTTAPWDAHIIIIIIIVFGIGTIVIVIVAMSDSSTTVLLIGPQRVMVICMWFGGVLESRG